MYQLSQKLASFGMKMRLYSWKYWLPTCNTCRSFYWIFLEFLSIEKMYIIRLWWKWGPRLLCLNFSLLSIVTIVSYLFAFILALTWLWFCSYFLFFANRWMFEREQMNFSTLTQRVLPFYYFRFWKLLDCIFEKSCRISKRKKSFVDLN